MSATLRIATRKSALALWQANFVKGELIKHHPNLNVELVPMSTQGDKILDTPLAKIGGKGLFIKELEVAMIEDKADIAVHSMKDVPVQLPDGFDLPVICERHSPYDAFVSNEFEALDELPQGAVVGTSSLRRLCQLRHYRPDLEIKDLRGNVNTRLAKLDEGQYDAIILAEAGLARLNMQDRIRHALKPELSLPAVGQGAVGIECKQNDSQTAELIAPLNCLTTAACVKTERAMNLRLNGGCQVPIAGFAVLEDEVICMQGRVGDSVTGNLLQSQSRGKDPNAIGTQVAEDLLAQGADKILAKLD